MPKPLPGDNPILRPEDDLLKRAGVAEAFARHVLAFDSGEGAAVGIFGSWGSGKTSFVNLARSVFHSEDVPVVDFNPWLFSGTDELVGRFFSELSAELRLRNLFDLGIALEDYGVERRAKLTPVEG